MSISITQRMAEAARGALDGKVAIVTGSGRGLGRAIARGYAAAGASVCCLARSEHEVAETVSLIAGAGGKASGMPPFFPWW